MAKDLRDSRRKNELITSHHIPINIYDRDDEMRGKSMERSSKRDNKNRARGSMMEL